MDVNRSALANQKRLSEADALKALSKLRDIRGELEPLYKKAKTTPGWGVVDAFLTIREQITPAMRTSFREKLTSKIIIHNLATNLWLDDLSSVSTALDNFITYQKPPNLLKSQIEDLIKYIEKVTDNEKDGRYNNESRLKELRKIATSLYTAPGKEINVDSPPSGMLNKIDALYTEKSKQRDDLGDSYKHITDTIEKFEKEKDFVDSLDIAIRTLREWKKSSWKDDEIKTTLEKIVKITAEPVVQKPPDM